MEITYTAIDIQAFHLFSGIILGKSPVFDVFRLYLQV
jgi:hypothetical protein